jgi:ubiquinone/menaquinone biosynthesis C-methylase UbiE
VVDKEVVREGYDELAPDYAEQREAVGDGVEALEAMLADLPADSRVLDAGCGQGTPVLERIETEATGVGADLSRGQLGLAAGNVPTAALAQTDMTRLPFTEGAFDAVTTYYSLVHIPEGDHQIVIDEFARVLRPGGRAIVIEGTNEWRGSNSDWLDSGTEMQWHIVGPDATREQLRNAGFEVREERVVGGSLEEEGDWQMFVAELAE